MTGANRDLEIIQEHVETLTTTVIDAATARVLDIKLLKTLSEAVRQATAIGANSNWLRTIQQRLAPILDQGRYLREADNLRLDPVGRRRAVRISEPPLIVNFENGHQCLTKDWSPYGILIYGWLEAPAAGTHVVLTITSSDVEGGGPVVGRVVWHSPGTNETAIEFDRPSLTVQTLKVRLLRNGQLAPSVHRLVPQSPDALPQ